RSSTTDPARASLDPVPAADIANGVAPFVTEMSWRVVRNPRMDACPKPVPWPSRRRAECVPDDPAHLVELGFDRGRERELTAGARLLMGARASVALRIPTEIALLERIDAEPRRELDGDRQRRVGDRGPFGIDEQAAGGLRIAFDGGGEERQRQ